MPNTLTEVKPADSGLFKQAAQPPDLWFANRIADSDLSAARGVMMAILISIPIWALVGVAIYLRAG